MFVCLSQGQFADVGRSTTCQHDLVSKVPGLFPPGGSSSSTHRNESISMMCPVRTLLGRFLCSILSEAVTHRRRSRHLPTTNSRLSLRAALCCRTVLREFRSRAATGRVVEMFVAEINLWWSWHPFKWVEAYIIEPYSIQLYYPFSRSPSSLVAWDLFCPWLRPSWLHYVSRIRGASEDEYQMISDVYFWEHSWSQVYTAYIACTW